MKNAPLRAHSMLAGDVARALGVGVQTLHYYEREGLIPRPARSESGYRLYPPDLVERVRFVRKAQALGLPLTEIGNVLTLIDQGTCPCGHVHGALAAKLHEVDQRLEELHSFREELAALIKRAPELRKRRSTGRLCAIVEDAPSQQIPDPARPARKRSRRQPAAGRRG